jgi:ureidoglycolate dehydrogenase (NAD+)
MFECLSSIMAANPLQEPILTGKKKEKLHNQNSVVAAIDIATFTDVEKYKETVDSYVDGIKALPKAEGFSEILAPGEPEDRTFAERSKNGIPLPEGTVKNLRTMATRFEVKLPAGL